MTLIRFNRHPSQRDRRLFGGLLVLFVAVLAGTLGDSWAWGIALAAGVALIYFGLPSVQRPIYLAVTCAAFPIGFVLSHLLLTGLFYLVVTPVGFFLKLVGRDPLQRRFDRQRTSYWIAKTRGEFNLARYFRQY